MSAQHIQHELLSGYNMTATDWLHLSEQAKSTLAAALGINDSVITTAPELLAALEAICGAKGVLINKDTVANAYIVIAKAKGGAQ